MTTSTEQDEGTTLVTPTGNVRFGSNRCFNEHLDYLEATMYSLSVKLLQTKSEEDRRRFRNLKNTIRDRLEVLARAVVEANKELYQEA